MRDEKRFAVLIDAENVSAKYITHILYEVSNYGVITYKRIYGDWTKPNASAWKEVLLENSITPIQQYSYTTGKNSSDSAMIIDAMDILYSNNVEGFCLVSSDSDFTKLASRLRESGMTVIGMGEEKTPKPFSSACNSFKYLNILLDESKGSDMDSIGSGDSNSDNDSNNKLDNSSQKVKEVRNMMTDISIIENAMIQIIIEYGDEKGIDAGELGSRLSKRYPDFDVRNYGYAKLSKFLESFDSIRVEKEGRHINVSIKDLDSNIEKVKSIVVSIINESKTKSVNMGQLNKCIMEKNPSFNIRNYGYTKFSKLINDLDGIKIESSGQNGSVKMVTLK